MEPKLFGFRGDDVSRTRNKFLTLSKNGRDFYFLSCNNPLIRSWESFGLALKPPAIGVTRPFQEFEMVMQMISKLDNRLTIFSHKFTPAWQLCGNLSNPNQDRNQYLVRWEPQSPAARSV